MKPATKSKRGGARPNSGPKPDIEKNLIRYRIALGLDVGLDRARRMLSEWDNRAEHLIGEKQVRRLRKLAASKDAQAALTIIKDMYAKRREELGFKP